MYHFVPSRLLLASHDAVACVFSHVRIHTHTHTYRMYCMYYLQNGKPTRHTEIRTRTQTAVSCTVLILSLFIKAERLQCQTPEHAGALSPALSCAYSSLHSLTSISILQPSAPLSKSSSRALPITRIVQLQTLTMRSFVLLPAGFFLLLCPYTAISNFPNDGRV